MTVRLPSRDRLLIVLALFAAGCANVAALSPGDSARQVETRMGAPAAIWKNADGSEVWEYPQGPLGVQTFMITLGPDKSVREIRQVLSEEYFKRVRAGMSRDDVRRLLGRQMETRYFGLSGEEVWSWRYVEWNVRPMFFNVHFDRAGGAVTRVSYTEEAKGGKKR